MGDRQKFRSVYRYSSKLRKGIEHILEIVNINIIIEV